MPFRAGAESLLTNASQIIIAVDSDGPGQGLADELVRRIGSEKCSRVQWIDGCKDANDVLMEWGADLLREVLDAATPYPVIGLLTPDDVEQEYLQLYDHGRTHGYSTGWPTMDAYFSIILGYFSVVTAIPGSGKSEWLDDLMIHLAKLYGWRSTMFSPEGMPTEEHLSRLAEKYMDKPFLPGPHPRMSRAEAIAAKAFAQEHMTFIVPEDPDLDQILRLAAVEVFRHGVKIVVIDPWNEVMHNRPSGQREDEYLSNQLRKVRTFAERHLVHVFIVNHPHAIEVGKDGQYPVVKAYDLNGGAMWINKTSAMISLWRDMVDPAQPVRVHIQKAKTRRIGRRGIVMLRYDIVTGRYHDTGMSEEAG